LFTDFLKSKLAKSQTLTFQILVLTIRLLISSGFKNSSNSAKDKIISLSSVQFFIEPALIQLV
jgi:hypothetical protein